MSTTWARTAQPKMVLPRMADKTDYDTQHCIGWGVEEAVCISNDWGEQGDELGRPRRSVAPIPSIGPIC
jgi:hypothetical protein